jgi:hypothetical protein
MSDAPHTLELIIGPDGRLRCLFDEFIDLAALGRVSIRRGSHVEPTEDGRWTADLSPVGGPVLGPFAGRSQALAAEAEYMASVRPREWGVEWEQRVHDQLVLDQPLLEPAIVDPCADVELLPGRFHEVLSNDQRWEAS